MRAEDRGILISKAEIAALLEFATTDQANELSRVRFFVDGDRCWAYASDGHRAIEADGESSDELSGEWAVERSFLEAVKKLLDKDTRAVLEFSGASLHSAVIEDEEEGAERGTVTWPHDAAIAQLTIETLRQVIKIPRTRETVRCVTVPGTQLAALALVAKAAGWNELDVYPPKTRSEPMVFRIDGGAGTTWTGCVMPSRDRGVDPDATAERHEARRSRGRRSDPRQTELA